MVHIALSVISTCSPLLKVPMAANCSRAAAPIDTLPGSMVMDVKVAPGGGTVPSACKLAEPLTPVVAALMVTVPEVLLVASPGLAWPEVSMLLTPELELFQATE